MAIITESWIYDIVCVTTALIAVVAVFYKWSFNYWKQRNVETLPPSIPFGNATEVVLQKTSFSEAIRKAYHHFRSKGIKHFGYYFFARPIYVAADIEIIKHILQKDFQHFVNRGVFFNEKDDPLSAHLFALEDTKWKNLRAKLTPTFTSGRLKAMFQTLVDCSKDVKVVMDDMSNGEPVDIKEILGRFTTDIIGSCAFGIECNSLKDPEAEFRKYGRRTFEVDFNESIKFLMQFAIPRNILRKFGFKATKHDVNNFFMNAVKNTVEYREANNVYRKDFMHLLLQLKNRGKLSEDGKIFGDKADNANEVSLTFNELAAQAFVFFLAGFETSSTTMTFAFYELATHQDIQNKLRKEINDVLAKHDNKITYDALMEMQYMDQVINETLRKYPPVGILNRECNSSTYRVPGTDVTLEKDTQIFIPVMGIHHDPEYYPEPEQFKPERFNDENKSKRPAFAFLPFGEGPRICIGLRFGIMQSKVGLASLLRDYKFTLHSKTKTPLKFDPQQFVTTADGGIWLEVEKL